MTPLVSVVIIQILFSASNVLARQQMRHQPWGMHLLTQPWLYLYFLMQLSGIILQLYVFTVFELGKTASLLSVIAIVTSVTLGWLVLGEKLSLLAYIAIVMAMIAFILLAYSRS